MAFLLNSLLATLPGCLSFHYPVLIDSIFVIDVASSAWSWWINCQIVGLATTVSLDTEFHDSEELVENSVPFRRDSLTDQVVMAVHPRKEHCVLDVILKYPDNIGRRHQLEAPHPSEPLLH